MTIGRRNVVAVAGVTLVLSGIAASARAADLPAAVRSAAPADEFKAPIGKYVSEQLARVAGSDPKAAGQARDELYKQVESTQVFTPSASFQTIYVSAVLSNIGNLQNSPDVLVRLNAAIIVCKLCDATGLSQLSDPVLKALNDPSPAVCLWGMKATKSLLPPVLAVPLNQQNQKLTPAMVAAVKSHHDIASLVQDAYDALTLPLTPPSPASALNLTASTSCDILNIRIADYKTGVAANPLVDNTPLLYVSRSDVIQAMTPALRVKAVQAVCDLLVVCVRRAATTPPGSGRDDLYNLASRSAGGLSVMLSGTPAAGQFAGLGKLPGASTGKEIIDNTVAAVRALSSTPEYKAIKPLAE